MKNRLKIVQRIISELLNKETGGLSDGYHTFNELYHFRMLYNAALFNEWGKQGKYAVHKSKRHFTGEECFGGGWFVVCAELPTGQISNHYSNEYWHLFNIPEYETSQWEWDGHTSQDVSNRLEQFLGHKQSAG